MEIAGVENFNSAEENSGPHVLVYWDSLKEGLKNNKYCALSASKVGRVWYYGLDYSDEGVKILRQRSKVTFIDLFIIKSKELRLHSNMSV